MRSVVASFLSKEGWWQTALVVALENTSDTPTIQASWTLVRTQGKHSMRRPLGSTTTTPTHTTLCSVMSTRHEPRLLHQRSPARWGGESRVNHAHNQCGERPSPDLAVLFEYSISNWSCHETCSTMYAVRESSRGILVLRKEYEHYSRIECDDHGLYGPRRSNHNLGCDSVV